jgi:hypothetical protein
MRRARRVEALPQLDILHRLLVGGAPAVLLPAVDPLGDAVAHVDAIGEEAHPARPLQRLQPLDGRHQLHAVVGGGRVAAGEFALAIADTKDRPPAARSGISAARAVGEDLDLRVLAHSP